jgi:hypothetical protein
MSAPRIGVVTNGPESVKLGRLMEDRVLLYLNLLAASVVDLAVAIALARMGPQRNAALLVSTVLLLPALLGPALALHRRLAAAID